MRLTELTYVANCLSWHDVPIDLLLAKQVRSLVVTWTVEPIHTVSRRFDF